GLFGTHDEAERGVNMLAASSFAVDSMGFLGPGEIRERNQARAQAVGVGAGGAMGAFAGGALGALAASAVPGIGPVITAGALLPIIIGILTGGASGGTVGSLLAAAGSNDQIAYFVQEVRSGRSLVGVQTSRVQEAEDVLLGAGALEAADVGGVEFPEPGSVPQERARGSVGPRRSS
ncbi:MAG: hypothetical protein J2P45_17490, partial [Candidatus Dormibacteraeota bacterium]|nr:hypothetical protein [Candidatus Dormibacteraeota bacterium]